MPVVVRIGSLRIEIYLRDHPPPHFHAIYQGQRVKVAIGSLRVIEGGLPPGQMKALRKWAKQNEELLTALWAKYTEE